MGKVTGVPYMYTAEVPGPERIGMSRVQTQTNRLLTGFSIEPVLNAMVAAYAVKNAVVVTALPTVRTLPSGVPIAPLLNLAARAPSSSHAHGHSHGHAGPRGDAPPRWAGGLSRTSAGLVSTTYLTCMSCFCNTGLHLTKTSQHPRTPASSNVLFIPRLHGKTLLMCLISQNTAHPTLTPIVLCHISWLEQRVCSVPPLPSPL